MIFFHYQPALPKVIDFDEDVDYEDEEEFMDHGHSLMDELELHLTSQDEMNKIVQEVKSVSYGIFLKVVVAVDRYIFHLFY